MTTNTFAGLGLPETLVRSLEQAGFTTPTPIQTMAIPAQLEGRDVLGIAQTGSGKTAAFSLPILTALMAQQGRRDPKTVGALILAPTRELAVQIDEMIRSYARRGSISTVLVLGGMSRSAQINKLARGVDIVVATPGRLSDLLEDRKLRLDQTHYLVLDEADRMLDMGFIMPVTKIARACAADRRTVLFSATMAPEVGKLAAGMLKDPVRVEVSVQGTTVPKVEQSVIFSGSKQKRDALNGLLSDEGLSRVIVFARTKHGADRVAKNLDLDGHSVAAIHGNKSQNARQAALKAFRAGNVRLLVATDIAARGIDVPDISHVINYELPDEAENYVHRIGRTARNGASGVAVSLVDGTEKGKLRDIERLIRFTLPKSGEVATVNGDAKPAPRRGNPGRGWGKTANAGASHGKPRGAKRPTAPSADRGWWATMGEGKSAGERVAGDRPAKSGKPGKSRWNKKRKDVARTTRTTAHSAS